MRRYAPLLFAFAMIGSALSAPSVTQAQDRPSVCFYEHTNFQGRAYCIRVGERVGFVGNAANDQFSSVRVPRGAEVTMCEHSNFRGRCRTLRHSESTFVPMGFNDMVSAVAAQWEDRGGRDRGPPDRGWDRRDDRDRGRDWDRRQHEDHRRERGPELVCFFEHDHYRGRRFCAPVGRDVSWVGDSYNDMFSSVQMPRGVTVTACRDKEFRGPCHTFRGNIDFLGSGWNDMISSFRSR